MTAISSSGEWMESVIPLRCAPGHTLFWTSVYAVKLRQERA